MRWRRSGRAPRRWCSTNRRAAWATPLAAMAEAFGAERRGRRGARAHQALRAGVARHAWRAGGRSFAEGDTKGEAVILVGRRRRRRAGRGSRLAGGARRGARRPAAARRGRRDHRTASGSSARRSTMPPSPSRPKSSQRQQARGSPPKLFGRRGETLAAWFLRLKGYRIVAQPAEDAGRRDRPHRPPLRHHRLRRGEEPASRARARARRAASPSTSRPHRARRRSTMSCRHPRARRPPLRFDVIFLAPLTWPRHVHERLRRRQVSILERRDDVVEDFGATVLQRVCGRMLPCNEATKWRERAEHRALQRSISTISIFRASPSTATPPGYRRPNSRSRSTGSTDRLRLARRRRHRFPGMLGVPKRCAAAASGQDCWTSTIWWPSDPRPTPGSRWRWPPAGACSPARRSGSRSFARTQRFEGLREQRDARERVSVSVSEILAAAAAGHHPAHRQEPAAARKSPSMSRTSDRRDPPNIILQAAEARAVLEASSEHCAERRFACARRIVEAGALRAMLDVEMKGDNKPFRGHRRSRPTAPSPHRPSC